MYTFKLSSATREGLNALGIDLAAVLRKSGLPLALWTSGHGMVTTDQFFDLWRAIGELSADPGIGLKLPLSVPVEKYHPAIIAAHHARTYRDALERFARYKILCCMEEVRLRESNGECRLEFEWLMTRTLPPSVLVDASFVSALELGRRGAQRMIKPVRVEFHRPASHVEMYESAFGCRVSFKEARDSITFRSSDLDLPFVTYNAELLEMLTPQLDHQLAQRRNQKSIGDRVKWILKRLLGAHRPGISDVAKELGMSSRTLQRRITDEGKSFRELLSESRRDLAYDYLKQPSLNISEIAYLLSYEDPSSFFRAFQEWEGVTPTEWKSRL